ncbi:hypothetical protein ABZ436_18475 [Micromonospora matsumotoense]|uniref:hypothetical protein n=1 Tax=Micromonospora matsumotoense TaxID=121616 RepID=UPI0033EDA112
MPPRPHLPSTLAWQVFRGSDAIRQGLLTRHHLRGASWLRLGHDVYADARLDRDHALTCRAALLRMPAATVIAGPSAAYLHGIEHAAGFGDEVHVLVPRAARVGSQGAITYASPGTVRLASPGGARIGTMGRVRIGSAGGRPGSPGGIRVHTVAANGGPTVHAQPRASRHRPEDTTLTTASPATPASRTTPTPPAMPANPAMRPQPAMPAASAMPATPAVRPQPAMPAASAMPATPAKLLDRVIPAAASATRAELAGPAESATWNMQRTRSPTATPVTAATLRTTPTPTTGPPPTPPTSPRSSPALAAWETAAWLEPIRAVGIVDSLLGRGLTSPAELTEIAQHFADRRGGSRARRVFDLADPAAQSPPESHLRVRLVLAGLPRPVAQHPVRLPSGLVLHPDLAWPEFRVSVEYDGHWHTDPDQLHRDRRRLNQLVAAGWIVLHVTSRRLKDDFPTVVREVREVLTQRGWRR